MISGAHAAALACAVALLVPVMVRGAERQDHASQCPSVGPVEWQPTSVPGVEVIRNLRYDFDLEKDTVDRLVDRQYEAIREKAVKELGADLETFDAEQGADIRKQIVEEMMGRVARLVCFDSVRVDTEKATIDLVNAVSEINARIGVQDGVRLATVDNKTGYLPVDYDVKTLIDGDIVSGNLFGLFNAGWSEGITRPGPVGYLRIDNEEVTGTFFPGLSAILCIVRSDADTVSSIRYYYAQLHGKFAFKAWHDNPVTTWSKNYLAEFNECDDAVQVGPRIIEDDNVDFSRSYRSFRSCAKDVEGTFPGYEKKIGICESSILTPLRRRSVIVSLSPDETSEEPKGRVHLLVTHNAVALYDLQVLLLKGDLIEEKSRMWAVNLAGDSQIFQYSRDSSDWVRDNPATPLYSALRVRAIEGR